MNLTDVTNKITELGAKYQRDYGIAPFNVCVGPEEFNLIYNDSRDTLLDKHQHGIIQRHLSFIKE